MKKVKLLILSMVIATTVGCVEDDDYVLEDSGLVGEWSWVSTDGGIAGNIHHTPESIGKEITLIMNIDYSYEVYEDDTLVSDGIFDLVLKNSIYSQELTVFIELTDNYSYQNVVIAGAIVSLDDQTLNISDNFSDGVASIFERKN
jgi:hypothetical protein